jgi:homoserine O-succinyltransferase
MKSRSGPSGARPLVIGLLNNMPDAALEATERQFEDLLGATSPEREPVIRCFSLREIERGERARAHMRDRYLDIDSVSDAGLDGLIVTGAEPRATTFDGEIYWNSLARVIDWTQATRTPVVWSCLAAHAAVWRLDAIPRRRLARKLSGVFDLQAVDDHPFLEAVSAPIRSPHSRLNGLDEEDLLAAGYQILTRSGEVGVDAFVRPGPAINLFFQGHPEYDPDSLAREYLRDVSRFLQGEQAIHPLQPSGCFDAQTALRLESLTRQAQARRDPGLTPDYLEAVAGSVQSAGWRSWAAQIYTAWLDRVGAAAEPRRSMARVAISTALAPGEPGRP